MLIKRRPPPVSLLYIFNIKHLLNYVRFSLKSFIRFKYGFNKELIVFDVVFMFIILDRF